ncbi:ABC-type glutathione transport system ATPase component [Catenuloplanes nepalensis]|uniref:ABC-type glutathione transport system ATPase component n=1 Tax=Catenuloplanes nepalensis TaxID=587533 RepID=A0ABT9MN24_9ACTN|nr:ABC transporter ATP-binding protein [Catenuloplanes nepalensis]MDP9792784.1 ABC-type glutathione transport system ATPase component [Catenuloplanes nepalensis]
MTALLSVAGLTIRDGARELVHDVSFDVAPGARIGLIGESGSGKSLTALAVTGLLPPGLTATGSAVLDGSARDTAADPAARGVVQDSVEHGLAGDPAAHGTAGDPAAHGLVGGIAARGTTEDPAGRGGAAVDMVVAPERQRIRARGGVAAVVFQEPLTALDPLMRVGKQIAEPLRRWRRLRGAALDAAVAAALDEVRLPADAARSFPHELSGGQRQRVAIAMALACRPRLLIADEPTTALDVTVQAEILDLLDGLVRDRGMALLFITHDLPVAARIADHLLVLRDGRVVESGPAASVIGSPSHEYTRTLVAGARRFDAALDLAAPPAIPLSAGEDGTPAVGSGPAPRSAASDGAPAAGSDPTPPSATSDGTPAAGSDPAPRSGAGDRTTAAGSGPTPRSAASDGTPAAGSDPAPPSAASNGTPAAGPGRAGAGPLTSAGDEIRKSSDGNAHD